jgi:hypothetical protein
VGTLTGIVIFAFFIYFRTTGQQAPISMMVAFYFPAVIAEFFVITAITQTRDLIAKKRVGAMRAAVCSACTTFIAITITILLSFVPVAILARI